MHPEIAVIIVNWEKPRLTIDCVNSLLKNTYKDIAIIIVDNYSRNESFSVLKKKFAGNQKIMCIRTKQNIGYAGGNNFGVKFASKKCHPHYVCVLNNDTVAENHFLENLREAAKLYGEDNIYSPLILSWNSHRILTAGLNDFLPTPSQFKYRNRLKSNSLNVEKMNYLGGCCMFIKSAVYEKLGGLREDFFMYSEDIEFGIKAVRNGAELYCIPKAVIHHRGASSFTPLGTYYSVRNSFYLIQDYFHNSKVQYCRAVFWFLIIFCYQLICIKPKASWAIVQGSIAFLRKEKGKSTHLLQLTGSSY